MNASREIWASMRQCGKIDMEKWSLILNPSHDESAIDYIKVPVRMKGRSSILGLLFRKKERIVLTYNPKREKKNVKLDIQKDIAYLVDDNIDSILNNNDNFKQVNNVILQYNSRVFFTVNEKEALKRLKQIKDSFSTKNTDKLLDF